MARPDLGAQVIDAYGWPSPKREAVGRRVRTKRVLRNYNIEIPAGTVLTVIRYWINQADLKADPCDICGVAVFIRRVLIEDLELLPESDQESPDV